MAKESAQQRMETSFPNDVVGLQMQVLRDDGVYRHINFRKPDDSFAWFEIVTWPKLLVINGDMGSFMFWRIEDMFEFFRHDRPNYDYWAEKVVAQDRDGLYLRGRYGNYRPRFYWCCNAILWAIKQYDAAKVVQP